MPQLTLQYTKNISYQPDFKDLFSNLHKTLNELADMEIKDCKSRAVALDTFYIGSGDTNNSFVHLEVKFLEGRSKQIKKLIGEDLLSKLQNAYTAAFSEMNLQITVEILDIIRQDYFKYTDSK
jgi:5-carboxymethyl-2-hydroxymuconate isomerase